MDDDQQFCLRWNNHQSTLISVFDTLLENGTLVDCTLAAEGKFLKAHKVVLSACSPYFATLLSQQYDKHPIFILKDVKFQELRAMMDYMYRGEVNISQDQLAALLKAAESLQIKGLSDSRGTSSTSSSSHNKDHLQKAKMDGRNITITEQKRQKLGGHHAPTTVDHSIEMTSREGSASPTSRKRKKTRRRSTEAATNAAAIAAAAAAANNLSDHHDQHSNSSFHSLSAVGGASAAATAASLVSSSATTSAQQQQTIGSSTSIVTGALVGGVVGSGQTTHITTSSAILLQPATTSTTTTSSSSSTSANVTKKTEQLIHDTKLETEIDDEEEQDHHHQMKIQQQQQQQQHHDHSDDGDDDDDDDEDSEPEQLLQQQRKRPRRHVGGVDNGKSKMDTDMMIEPKSEYEDGQDEPVEDLTLDDEELMEDLDQAGPSHGGGGAGGTSGAGGEGSSQGYAAWQVDRPQDEVFLNAQETGGQHRDTQAAEDLSITRIAGLTWDQWNARLAMPLVTQLREGAHPLVFPTDLSVSTTYDVKQRYSPTGSDQKCQLQLNETGYPCPDCGRVYKLKSSLRNHQKWECGKEPQFQCPFCVYRAKQKMHIGRHMERMHKEKFLKTEDEVKGLVAAIEDGNIVNSSSAT